MIDVNISFGIGWIDMIIGLQSRADLENWKEWKEEAKIQRTGRAKKRRNDVASSSSQT